MLLENFKFITFDGDEKSYITSSYKSSHFIRGHHLAQSEVRTMVNTASLYHCDFGKDEKDQIEFFIYNESGKIMSNMVITSSHVYTDITRSYTDIHGIKTSYSFSKLNNSYVVLNGKQQRAPDGEKISDELLISPIDDLNKFDLSDGSYKICYSPIRNVVGDRTNRLIIKEISNDGREIVALPAYPRNDTSHANVINEFYGFASYSFIVREIIDDIEYNLNNNNLYDAMRSFIDTNNDLYKQISFLYSFKNEAVLYEFCSKLFDIIKFQYQQTLFASYNNIVQYADLDNYFNRLCSYIVDRELTRINNNLPIHLLPDYILHIAFFYNIFDSILGLLSIRNKKFESKFGLLRNYINFGDGSMQPILTWKNLRLETYPNKQQHFPIILKLLYPLPTQFKVGSEFYISNIQSSPRVFNVTLYKPSEYNLRHIRNPNFNIRTENSGEATKTYTFDELVSSGSAVTQKLLNHINQNVFDKNLNIDYSVLEEFVQFSSVTDRISVYDQKTENIEYLNQKISELNSYATQSYSIYYDTEKLKYINEINNIKTNFDGYEKFLYYSPLENGVPWRDIHYQSASYYDKFNDNALINNVPREIIDDPECREYRRFLSMIGHHFDLIYAYIKNFPTIKFAENNPNLGITQNMVYHVLTSLGFDAFSGQDTQDLWLSLFGDGVDDSNDNIYATGSLETISGQARTKTIWRRILNNFSYIVKTKGTEECIRAIMSCYGIPKYLFKIREYGGIEYSTDITQDSLFIFDSNNYYVRFSGSMDYLKTTWFGDAKSLEFKVKFNEYETDLNGSNFRIILNDTNWSVGFLRVSGSWGRGYFTLTDANVVSGSSLVQTMTTDLIPVFNGDIYSVLLRKNDKNPYFDYKKITTELELDLIPIQYDLLVSKTVDERVVNFVSSSLIVSGSMNTAFRTGSNLYIGNYSVNSQADLFYGNLDQLKVWKQAVKNERFNNHTMFNSSYDSENPYNTVENLLLKIDFDFPVSLYTTGSYVSIPNQSYNKSRTEYIEAYNFQNVPGYPYNFTLFENREVVNMPNMCSAKFRNNKIRKEEMKLVSNLSPLQRSTLKSRDRHPVDSNGLGVFFSPVDLIDDDILKFFGNYNISDFIGNPFDYYKPLYRRFEKFREIYFKNGGGRVDFQTYINLVKAYFDKSVFKHLNQVAPARASFKSGLLIEPTLLERNKYENKHVIQSIHHVSCSMHVGRPADGIVILSLNSEIDVFDKINNTPNPNYLYCYQPLEEWQYQIHADDDGGVTFVSEFTTNKISRFKAEAVTVKKSYTILNNLNKPETIYKDFNVVNLIRIDNNFTGSLSQIPLSSPTAKVFKGYHKNHYRTHRNTIGHHTMLTQEDTTNSEGLLDNSLPFYTTRVDKTSINVENNQNLNILTTS